MTNASVLIAKNKRPTTFALRPFEHQFIRQSDLYSFIEFRDEIKPMSPRKIIPNMRVAKIFAIPRSFARRLKTVWQEDMHGEDEIICNPDVSH